MSKNQKNTARSSKSGRTPTDTPKATTVEMPSDNDMQKQFANETTRIDGGLANANTLIQFLESHALAWFISGIVILAITENVMPVTIAGKELRLIPDKSIVAKLFVQTIAAIAAVLAFYIFFSSKYKSKIINSIALLLFPFALAYPFISFYLHYSDTRTSPKLTIVSHSFVLGKYNIRFYPKTINDNAGQFVVLVGRQLRNDSPPFENDSQVSISPMHKLPDQPIYTEQDFSVNLKDWKYHEGDNRFECCVVFMPSNTISISSAKTLLDLRQMGGKLLKNDPYFTVVNYSYPTFIEMNDQVTLSKLTKDQLKKLVEIYNAALNARVP